MLPFSAMFPSFEVYDAEDLLFLRKMVQKYQRRCAQKLLAADCDDSRRTWQSQVNQCSGELQWIKQMLREMREAQFQ